MPDTVHVGRIFFAGSLQQALEFVGKGLNLHQGTKGGTAIFTTRFPVTSYLSLAPPQFRREKLGAFLGVARSVEHQDRKDVS